MAILASKSQKFSEIPPSVCRSDALIATTRSLSVRSVALWTMRRKSLASFLFSSRAMMQLVSKVIFIILAAVRLSPQVPTSPTVGPAAAVSSGNRRQPARCGSNTVWQYTAGQRERVGTLRVGFSPAMDDQAGGGPERGRLRMPTLGRWPRKLRDRPEPAEVHDVEDDVPGLEDAVVADEPGHRHTGHPHPATSGRAADAATSASPPLSRDDEPLAQERNLPRTGRSGLVVANRPRQNFISASARPVRNRALQAETTNASRRAQGRRKNNFRFSLHGFDGVVPFGH